MNGRRRGGLEGGGEGEVVRLRRGMREMREMCECSRMEGGGAMGA